MEGAAAARGRLMQSTTYEEMADILAGMAAVADSAAAESVANTEASHG
jgi:hypothetical protein